MMSFIRSFKNRIPYAMQMVVVILIGLYTLLFGVSYSKRIFDVIQALLPVLLIVVSSILLSTYHKQLAGHGVLLLGIYMNGLTALFNELFSIQFNPFNYSPQITMTMIIHALIFLYLFFMILSYILNGRIKASPLKGKTVIIGIWLFIFVWVLFGFSQAISVLILPLIALLFGLKFPALLLMLHAVIAEPFRFIDLALNQGLRTWQAIDYIYLIGCVFFIVIISIHIRNVIRLKTYQK